jgi:hypothetical protein
VEVERGKGWVASRTDRTGAESKGRGVLEIGVRWSGAQG